MSAESRQVEHYTMPNWEASECIFYPKHLALDPRFNDNTFRIFIGLFRDPLRRIDRAMMLEIAGTLRLPLRKVEKAIRQITDAGYIEGDFVRRDIADGAVEAKRNATAKENTQKLIGTWQPRLHLAIHS